MNAVVEHLKRILANTHILYVKTLNYHWNVEDSRFYSIHKMLEEQYGTLAGYVDEFAERIRMLGKKSPGSLKEFLELGNVQEAKTGLSGNEMIADLASSHDAAIQDLRAAVKEAEDLGDPGTADLCIDALRDHEKTAWFLRSHL